MLFWSCFSTLLALRLPLLGKRELILVLFERLFDLHLFGSVSFFFLLVSWKDCGCYFVLVFNSPFSIAIPSLVEESANLSAFRTFVRFALVWFCLFPLPLGVWEGLRFVMVALPELFWYLCFMIVALPGLFSYLFYM